MAVCISSGTHIWTLQASEPNARNARFCGSVHLHLTAFYFLLGSIASERQRWINPRIRNAIDAPYSEILRLGRLVSSHAPYQPIYLDCDHDLGTGAVRPDTDLRPE
jgi:hypothetical protein